MLWRNERDKPSHAQTPAWIDAFGTKVTGTLAWFERASTHTPPGPAGLAHITLGCALSYIDFRFGALDWRGTHPALADWHATFSTRPSMRATEAVDA